MHCVVWTWRSPPSLSMDRADDLFRSIAERYVGVPGLVRTYFGYSVAAAEIVSIHLWQGKAPAEAFYDAAWLAEVTERWGAVPERADWVVPQVVDSESGAVAWPAAPRVLRSVGPEDEDRRVKPGEGGANDD